MKVLFTDEIRKKLAASRVVATVTIENVENAKPLAEALLEGGIRSIEITLRTPAAIDAIQRVTQSFPEMLVMAGTVISAEQVKLVQDVGVDEDDKVIGKKGDTVTVFSDQAPSDTVMGQDVFEDIHDKTKDVLLVTIEDIEEN